MPQISSFPAADLNKINPERCLILDVRTGLEHREKHLLQKHDHVPLDELDPSTVMRKHGLSQSDDVYLLCRTGARATRAAQKFIDAGYSKVHVIQGGLTACEECGQELAGWVADKGSDSAPRVISLERQVRIAAGSIVVIGSALALLLHPLFVLIPLFVGAGLVFAGITDRCGMALFLAKAPWNKV